MVEAGFFPVDLVVTVLAIGAQGFLVLVIFSMAADTIRGGSTVLHAGTVAARAGRPLMLSAQIEIGQRMIESPFIEMHNLRIPALVIGMAAPARTLA